MHANNNEPLSLLGNVVAWEGLRYLALLGSIFRLTTTTEGIHFKTTRPSLNLLRRISKERNFPCFICEFQRPDFRNSEIEVCGGGLFVVFSDRGI